jgi:hypothetical protein
MMITTSENATQNGAAFGMSEAAEVPYRFLIALAVLELLSDAAQRAPVLVVLEDAHWLDRSTADVLAFIARRVEHERIVVLIASREGVEGFFDDAGLPELRLGGLDDAAAESLLEAHGRRLAPAVREQLREQTGGNPPALVELPVLLGTDELGGRSLLPTPLPLTGPGQLHPWAPGHLLELPHFSGPPFASPSLIVPAYFRGDFAQDLNPKLAATLSAQQRPTDFSIFVTPSGPVAWHSLPSWYAVSGADRMIDPALQRAMAQRIGATTGEEPRPLPRVTRSLTLKIRRKEAQTGKGSGSRTRTEGQTIDRQWIIVISAYSASPPASGRPLSTVA